MDNNYLNFKEHPENAIFIETWINNEKDTSLLRLGKILTSILFLFTIYLLYFLLEIAKSCIDDVRVALQ